MKRRGWGGRRKDSGRKPGQKSRQPLLWNEQFHLKDRENIEAFLVHLIKTAWTQNIMDTRTVGALNNSLRLLCDMKGLISKTPLQVVQQLAKTGDLEKVLDSMSLEERQRLFEKWESEVIGEIESGKPGESGSAAQEEAVVFSEASVSSDGLGKLASKTDGRHNPI